MADATPEVTREYVAHALKIIRLSNGLRASAVAELQTLARRLRRLLLQEDYAAMSLAELKDVVAEADDIIYTTFEHLTTAQAAHAEELIAVEADWAAQTGNYAEAASERALAQAVKQLHINGLTIEEQFTQIADNLHRDMVSQLRQARTAGQDTREAVDRVVTSAANARGGVFERTLRDTRGAVDAQVHAAADAGRRASQKAGGINALEWHAVLDPKVCPNCGTRDGMIWSIDGEPLNTDLIYVTMPAHNWCRCIYLPLRIPSRILDKGLSKSNKFEDFLKTLTPEQEDAILGAGRAALWRAGKITLDDLIGQDGFVLSLGDLKAELG